MIAPRHLALRAATLTLVLSACTNPPTVIPTRNLDRPADMSFVCLGVSAVAGGAENVLTGRPMSVCAPPDTAAIPFDSSRPRVLGTFGAITNSGRGELGIVDLDRGLLVDLDPASFGFNFLPVGQFPEAVATSSDGCRVLVANRGSCDLTLVDPARLLASSFAPLRPSTGGGNPAQTVVPRTRSGRLTSAPYEIAFLPFLPAAAATPQASGAPAACPGDETRAGSDKPPWRARAIVTFPACDLVAVMELPSGQITSSVRILSDGVENTGDDPVCVSECGAGVLLPPRDAAGDSLFSPATSNVSSGDGGADSGSDPGSSSPAVRRPLHVTSLALWPDGSRVFVGGTDAPFITVLDVTAEGALNARGAGGRIALHEGAGGTTRLRLTTDPFGKAGGFLTQGELKLQFLYAMARDGSVRVIDVSGEGIECDVNVDPMVIGTDGDTAAHLCYPVTDDPKARTPRRPTATGPGLVLPMARIAGVPNPLPVDLAFASMTLRPGGSVPYDTLDGVFGFLLASNGLVYIVNLRPTPRATETSAPPFVHSLRVDLDPLATRLVPGRLTTPPTRTVNTTDLPYPTRVRLASPTNDGPRLEQFKLSDAPEDNTWLRFSPGAQVTTQSGSQAWSIAWEDTLPGTDRASGVLQAWSVADGGADFCRSGVAAGDIFALAGCLVDADCGPVVGLNACAQTAVGVPGLCVPASKAHDEAWLRRCSRHLSSRRRFEVIGAHSRTLDLALKLDEIPKPSIAACAVDSDCAVSFIGAEIPRRMPGVMGGPEYRCLPVGGAKRCVRPCVQDADCRAGFVCEDTGAAGRLCVEAPPPDPTCLPADVRYHVAAGRSFVLTTPGDFRYARSHEVDGICRADTPRHPLLIDRISIDAPLCKDSVGKSALDMVNAREPERLWGNPCIFMGTNGDEPPSANAPVHVKAFFANPQFRGVLTNLDQYFGDDVVVRLNVEGSFFPSRVDARYVNLGLGARLVTGPQRLPTVPYQYLFVVDQGRATTGGGRGQIMRIAPRVSGGLPYFDSQYSQSTFPIQ